VLNADPPRKAIDPGGVATYVIGVHSPSSDTYPVTLSTINSSPALRVSLAHTMVTPPGQAILTLTDTQSSTGSGRTATLGLTWPVAYSTRNRDGWWIYGGCLGGLAGRGRSLLLTADP